MGDAESMPHRPSPLLNRRLMLFMLANIGGNMYALRMRGTAFGLFHTSLGVVSLPAPWIGAQLWERVSPRFPFSLTAWISLLTIIPVWLKFKLSSNRDQIDAVQESVATSLE